MKIAVLENATLQYVLEGPADAPVVVLSNSLGTELTMWDGQAPALAKQFRVLRYDTRGHGGSRSFADRYSLDDLGSDVLALLDIVKIDRFHVCGVSLGGLTALWLAINAPRRVLSVMPCNTAARIGTDATWSERMDRVAVLGLASIADVTMERWFTAPFRQRDPAQVEAMRRMLLRTDARGYLACCAALRDADLSMQASAIGVPALVISGMHDPVTPPSDGRYLEQQIAGAQFEQFNTAHLSNIELPEAFLLTMLNFLRRFQVDS